MSNTYHHVKHNPHFDYSKKYRCNSKFSSGYGRDGRDNLHRELRGDDKTECRRGVITYFYLEEGV